MGILKIKMEYKEKENGQIVKIVNSEYTGEQNDGGGFFSRQYPNDSDVIDGVAMDTYNVKDNPDYQYQINYEPVEDNQGAVPFWDGYG